MKVYHNINEAINIKNPAVTVGSFDGVHIGHQEILRRLRNVASEIGGESVVITFLPHPRKILQEDHSKLRLINNPEKKIERLLDSGVDHLIIHPFTKEFASLSSETFITEYISGMLGTKKLILGYDHHFGRQREGNYEQLKKLGISHDFEVCEVPGVAIHGKLVSSTKIRHALNSGKISLANEYLGYTYSITGKVIHGNQNGRKMGFPTANIELDNQYKLIAANGVYACRVRIGDELFDGMGNIGIRPTLKNSSFAIEVNIFDFDREIYNQDISLLFYDRIRDEIKFKGFDELKTQLFLDELKVKEILKGMPV